MWSWGGFDAAAGGGEGGGASGRPEGKRRKNEIVSLNTGTFTLSPCLSTMTDIDVCSSSHFMHTGTSPILSDSHHTLRPLTPLSDSKICSPPHRSFSDVSGEGHFPYTPLPSLRESLHSLTEQRVHSPVRFSQNPLPLSASR